MRREANNRAKSRKLLNCGSAALLVAILLAGCSTAIPDLAGLKRSEVVVELADLGLRAEFSERHSETVPRGYVIESDPEAGEKAEDQSKIAVTLSKGAKPEKSVQEAPALDKWWPAGFAPATLEIAVRYTTEDYRGDPCPYSACDYWVMEVVSKGGCPSGLFLKLNILRGSLVIDSAIDSVSSLRAGQVAEMVFTKRNLGSGTFTSQFSSANCY
jgi:hypothetical protein